MAAFEPASDEPRIESWKAIASHLNRDVRTAKRWEIHEGLPVHRHRHLARSSVYAYPRELDAWRRGRKRPVVPPVQASVARKGRWLALAAGMAMATLAAGGGRFAGPPAVSAQAADLSAARLLWPGGGGPIPTGSVSFHGKYFAYQDGDGILMTRDLNSERVEAVPNQSGWRDGRVDLVRPSRGGDLIAYQWWDVPQQRWQLRVIARTGGVPRVLAERRVTPLAWTPDDRRVAVVQSDGGVGLRLSLVSVDPGAPEHEIARFPAGSIEAATVSPDGQWIAYDYKPGRDDHGDIYVANLEGGEPALVVGTDASERVLDWFPDGRHLLYVSNTGGTVGAWAVQVDRGRAIAEPAFVKGDLGRFYGLGFTEDGRYYSSVIVGGTNIEVVPLDPGTGLATCEPTPLPGGQPGVRRHDGTWSPTGDRIVYFRTAPMAPTELVVQHAGSGRTDVVPMALSNLERPNWHPDGTRVVVLGTDGQGPGAFEVDLTSGEVRRLTARTVYAVFTEDGQFLLYQRPPTGQAPRAIVRRRLRDGSEDLVAQPLGPGAWQLLPGGRSLLLYRGRATPASLSVMPIDNGEPRIVLDNIADAVGPYAASPDGRYAYYATGRQSDRMELWRVAIDGAQPERLGVSLPLMNHISASPDGSSLAVSGGVARFETWVWERLPDVVWQKAPLSKP